MTSADFDAIAINGEVICTDCAVKQNIDIENDPEVSPMFCDGESDTPQNCNYCHCPISYGLTKEGYEYVLDSLREELRRGANEYLRINDCYKGSYYDGYPHVRITLDWLDNIWFAGEDKHFVNKAKDWIYFQAKKQNIRI